MDFRGTDDLIDLKRFYGPSQWPAIVHSNNRVEGLSGSNHIIFNS